MSYGKVDRKIIVALTDIVGESGVFTDPDNLEKYSVDETTGVSGLPDVVVKPSTEKEVSAVMKLAHASRIPVTPRSGGTGVTGGAVPVFGGIILTLERMNRIIEIDTDNLMAVVEPGVITGDLGRRAEEEGLFYPPDPASLDSCCIGGNIAESAGGPRAVKYGTTKDYVCGLRVVFPDGSIAKMGGKVVKNATGYDLIGLMVGSEGTLGIVTEITLRLLPLPKSSVDVLVPFADLETASKAVSEIIRARIVPATIEFLDRGAIEIAEEFLKKKMPFVDAGAQLLIKIDGGDESEIERSMERIWEVCSSIGAEDMVVADSTAQRDRLWEGRRCIREAVTSISRVKEGEDVVVPRSEIPRLVEGAKRLLDGLGLTSIFFGHAGDGNVHVEILKGDLTDEQWEERLPKARERLYRLADKLGGLITGEHGIGLIRREYLNISLGDAEIEIMKRIKDAVDPLGILNPGKIFK
ncbi:MAG: FAD-binding protein [Deltaproteobacteria bacterium]|uniref:FAD-binding protein n=1 Tax=Candidatus Zymogenus saltonus TaxID=2844893 RepID=A0A9D8KGE2_9DELT|nr:FAD-binding protein [Candidatus Zymogenus saltonus]